ncbi:Protein CBG16016 [Caenorhabditis briggsae]|uniref:non-specific protein-tyrosine kinase n=1 Tax=Caenorhabditis briggsae TaxID=6238 RepID=A8XNA0_CAEBR|nr:Protein CBG16016 [Caenorhabditis briggsae]CAP34331.3 Protein CBG16016 [Caenorhabditis briggsae]
MASTGGVLVDDIVLEVLRKSQLEAYQDKFVFVFNVRRFDHFSHVRDKDMQDIGMQQPQIRQLREQILKMSREMWNRSDPKQVYVAGDQSTQNQSAIDEKAFIPNEQIKLFEQLGEGSFAVVRRRTWARSNGQKTSEPILSTEVLQPTRVPSAASTPKPVSQPVPTPQPVRTNVPLLRIDVAVKILRDISPERCKFGTIREDLNSAFFLDAVAREGYNSIQPGALILAKGDEVVVVENTGQDWFGQNKKNQQFGTFPRSVVFAQTNHAVAAASAVTPQKVPTAPTIRMRPEPVIQAPPPLPFASKPLNNNTKTSYNDRTSRISMPVAGSFIHTGHGDPLGGQSWGNPSNIDDLYLKNPVKGVPLSSMSNGAQVIASKELLTNGGRSTHTPDIYPIVSCSNQSCHVQDSNSIA